MNDEYHKVIIAVLGSDMNDEYHKVIIVVWKAKVVVQVVMPNDHSKQDQNERVVLLSLVSQVEKNVMVKNKVVNGRLFQSVYRVSSNINLNKIL